MQVTETSADGLKREFKVVIAANDINEKLEARLQEIGQQVRVPGFRPGKVPLQILKQRFSQQVLGEVLERAVNDSSSQAITERGLRPAIQPKIEITSFEENKDLEYKLDLELMPEITVMDFAELELERTAVTVDDDEVDLALGNLAQQMKQPKALDAPRKSQSGDVLVIDFKGSVDGEELPGMSGEDHHLELGSNRFVEGFEEQLTGADVGDDRTVTVTFPKEYVNDKLAGREAIFEVKIKDIKEPVVPEVDDEMAKTLGEEDLNGLRGKVKEQLERDYGQVTRARMKRVLLDKLAEKHDFPVPVGMADAEYDVIWEQVKKDLDAGTLDDDDKDKSEEQLQKEYREIAERRVRLGLLLSEVGRANGIEVSQEEVQKALVAEAQKYPGKEREVFEFYQNSPEAMANLRAPLFEDKVVDFITALAKVSEHAMSSKELRDQEGIEVESEAETASQEASSS
ncbi:MAG: trigger factor [Pseudomonadota bacterium]